MSKNIGAAVSMVAILPIPISLPSRSCPPPLSLSSSLSPSLPPSLSLSRAIYLSLYLYIYISFPPLSLPSSLSLTLLSHLSFSPHSHSHLIPYLLSPLSFPLSCTMIIWSDWCRCQYLVGTQTQMRSHAPAHINGSHAYRPTFSHMCTR